MCSSDLRDFFRGAAVEVRPAILRPVGRVDGGDGRDGERRGGKKPERRNVHFQC